MFVGTFEDAVLGVILNANLEAVVIYDGFPYPSGHDVPLLRSVLASRLSIDPKDRAPQDYGLLLAKVVTRIRPELDLFLLADRKPEDIMAEITALLAAHGLRVVGMERDAGAGDVG